MQLDEMQATLAEMRSELLNYGLFKGERDESLLLIAGHVNAAHVLIEKRIKALKERHDEKQRCG